MESQNKIEKFDLSDLLKDFQATDNNLIKLYFSDIWDDLSQRPGDHEKGIEKITFDKYYQLPGILSERLFSVFDQNKDGYLDKKEFVSGMKSLFYQNRSVKSLAELIFKIYDFNQNGKITKEDVRLVLSYIPLYKNSSTYLSKQEPLINYYHRIESQTELNNIINNAFKNKTEMDLNEFISLIQNENSDLFIFILMVLLEKKPFSHKSYSAYQSKKEKKASPEYLKTKTPKVFHAQIASPSLDSPFASPCLQKKALTQKKKREFGQNILSLYSGENKDNIINHHLEEIKEIDEKKNEKSKSKSKDKDIIKNNEDKDYRPTRRKLKNLVNLENISPPLMDNKVIIAGEDEQLSLEIDENIDDFDEGNIIKYEEYMCKYSQKQKRMNKIYFKLIGKDLFFYKDKNDINHAGMHNLSDVYIKSCECETIDNIKYYPLSIIFPQRERKYYLLKEEDRQLWLNNIQKALNEKNIKDKYEITNKIIGKGKFGYIKLGINKENKEIVAIKILSKNQMDKIQIELSKTEIEIMKIAQHPNIIKLYDVYENNDYIYIVMEYCKGGDLLSYIEKTNYCLPESKACEIVHKLSMAIYYIHQFGIIHRDLKPENILITDKTKESDIRLMDFGLSKIIGPGEKCKEPYGTLSFVAPEILMGVPYDKSVDLWGIGIITYLLVSGYLPFEDKHSEKEIARQTVEDKIPFPPKIWSKLSHEVKDLVTKLLNKNPEKRLTIKEVLEHPWIKQFSKAV